MGSLEVVIEKGFVASTEVQSQTYIVRYLCPFYGVTGVQYEGSDPADFNDVQKSYGMWFVPPDVGTQVLVIFLEGDPNQGFWIGCVPDTYQNYMVPGIASSQDVYLSPEQQLKYGTTNLPAAEFHKRSIKAQINPDSQKRPVHPFADRLLAQGLLLDNVRGITSSSARRDIKNSVFGISTPGPLDPAGKMGLVGYEDKVNVPVSRLGGTQFVMDDGDENGHSELVRIRTRTGHQILLHNSSDLIYIGNSKGTAWIELTSNGKIDVYAEDSISIRTKGDFNLRADRDFNLEAGRNFNVNTAFGETNFNVRTNFNILSDTMKIGISENYDLSVGKVITETAGSDINRQADGEMKQSSLGRFNISSSEDICMGAAGQISIGAGGLIKVTGSEIHLNGPSATPPNIPSIAEKPLPLNLYSVPQRDVSAGWANKQFYRTPDLLTTLQRVPTHEPWDQHENINPQQFTLDRTDTQIAAGGKASNGAIVGPPLSANNPFPSKNGSGKDRGTFRGSIFYWSTDQPFLTKVKDVAQSLGFDPIDLLAIINLETDRTFDPAITNRLGYTGLIQFGRAAAKGLGTTTDALRQMSRNQQMDYVYGYFHDLNHWPNSRQPNPTLVNLYLTVLLPVSKFASPDEKIADASNPKTAAYYNANKGFDPTLLGYFTPAMVEATVLQHKREVLQTLANAGVGQDLIVPPQ
jgi:hypothetical protein